MTEKKLGRVLMVDDEASIVNAVRRELNSPPALRYHYEVETYTDPVLALARAGEQSFDVVISDYRMPVMDGLELLKELARLQPDCARIVLSGHTDMEALVRMINETHIYRFIPKPWHDYYLKGSVAQALAFRATLLEHQRLAKLIRDSEILAVAIPESETDRVLVVDDDPGVLASLARVLTRHSKVDDLFAAIRAEVTHTIGPTLREELLDVQVTPSPLQALKLAESSAYSCIIADHKMPEMDGVELLRRFAELQPDCQRLLISGGIASADLILAVDSAHIFAYIAKPWTDYELKAQVALALAQRKMLRENRMLAEMVSKSSHLG